MFHLRQLMVSSFWISFPQWNLQCHHYICNNIIVVTYNSDNDDYYHDDNDNVMSAESMILILSLFLNPHLTPPAVGCCHCKKYVKQ